MANSISLKHDDNGFLLGRKLDKAQFDKNLKQTLDNTKAIIKKLDGRRVGNRIVVTGRIKHESKGSKQPVVISNSPRNRPSTANASNTTKTRVISSNSHQKPSQAHKAAMIVSSREGVKLKGSRSNINHGNQGKVAMDARASKQFALRQERAQQKLSLEDAKEQRNQTDLLETIAKKIGGGSGKSESLLSKLLPGLPFSPKFLGGGLLGKVLGGFLGGKKGGAVRGGLGGGNPAKQAGKGLLGGVLSKGKGLLGSAAKIKGLGFLGLGLTALESIGVENSEMDRGDKNKQHLKNGMSLGGALAGGAAGLKAGAVLGSVVPGLGTGVGAILGGLVGSFAGAGVADYAMDAIDDAIDPKLSKKMLGSWDGFVFTAKQGISTLWKEMPQPVQNFGNAVVEEGGKAVEGAKTVIENVKEKANTAVETTKKIANKVVDSTKAVLGVEAPKVNPQALKDQHSIKNLGSGMINPAQVPRSLKMKNFGENINGGAVHAGIVQMAYDTQTRAGKQLQHFAALNDEFHAKKRPKSFHVKGLAFDSTFYKEADGKQYVETVKNRLEKAGFKSGKDFMVQWESKLTDKSGRITRYPHMHFEWKSKEAAARYAEMVNGNSVETNAASNQNKANNGLIPQDSQLQRNNDAARRGGNSSYVPSTVGMSSTSTEMKTLKKSDPKLHHALTYTGGIISTMSDSESRAYAANVAETESAHTFDKTITNKFGYLGLYQFGAAALAQIGLIDRKKYDTAIKKNKGIASGVDAKAHKAFLSDQSNWTIKGGRETFLNNEDIQHQAFAKLANNMYSLASTAAKKKMKNNPELVAKYLKMAHLKWVEEASKGIVDSSHDGKDGNKTSMQKYGNGAARDLLKYSKVVDKNLNSGVVLPVKLMSETPKIIQSERAKIAKQAIDQTIQKTNVESQVNINSLKPSARSSVLQRGAGVENIGLDEMNSSIAHLPARQVSQKSIAYAAAGGTSG